MNKIFNRLPFSRSVLSRAELEAIPLDNNLKEDVVKGKVSVFLYLNSEQGFMSCHELCLSFTTSHSVSRIRNVRVLMVNEL